jgi:hypothetical protein
MRWSQASAVAELGIRMALKAQFIGAMFGGEHAAAIQTSIKARSLALTQMILRSYVRTSDERIRRVTRSGERASSRAVSGVSPENMFGETTRRSQSSTQSTAPANALFRLQRRANLSKGLRESRDVNRIAKMLPSWLNGRRQRLSNERKFLTHSRTLDADCLEFCAAARHRGSTATRRL